MAAYENIEKKNKSNVCIFKHRLLCGVEKIS